jgi:hypothetical protein
VAPAGGDRCQRSAGVQAAVEDSGVMPGIRQELRQPCPSPS